MAKVKEVVARKDYPQYGIKKGEKHFHWVLKTGPRSSSEFRQKARPRRAQLTTSEFLSAIYDLIDVELQDVMEPDDMQNVIESIESAKGDLEDKLNNMPEGLQQGTTGQLLETRIAACEEIIHNIEEATADWEAALDQLEEDETTSDETREAARKSALESIDEPDWG